MAYFSKAMLANPLPKATMADLFHKGNFMANVSKAMLANPLPKATMVD